LFYLFYKRCRPEMQPLIHYVYIILKRSKISVKLWSRSTTRPFSIFFTKITFWIKEVQFKLPITVTVLIKTAWNAHRDHGKSRSCFQNATFTLKKGKFEKKSLFLCLYTFLCRNKVNYIFITKKTAKQMWKSALSSHSS